MSTDVCIKGLSFALLFTLVMVSIPVRSDRLAAASDTDSQQEAPKNASAIEPDIKSTSAPLVDASAGAQQIESAAYRYELLGNLTSKRLSEASGLALSTRSQDLAWAHNDSGHGPYIFAFTLTGENRGRFYLEKTGSSDWEDMDAFRWQDESWLLLADTGDNRSIKPHYTLYMLAEPELPENQTGGLKPLRGVQRARIKFPTGPADTEAVAVDEIEERVYLITKRKRPAEVFSVPLEVFKDGKSTHVARFESTLYPLPTPTLQDLLDRPRLGLAFGQPNGLDISSDRSFAVVQTYGSSFRFDRAEHQTWAQAFASAPKQIEVPTMKQSEAVAIGSDNQSVYYTSEGKYPPLYRLEPVKTNSPQ